MKTKTLSFVFSLPEDALMHVIHFYEEKCIKTLSYKIENIARELKIRNPELAF